MIRRGLWPTVLTAVTIILISCASTKAPESNIVDSSVESIESPLEKNDSSSRVETELALPVKLEESKKSFAAIDPEIIKNIEIGSLSSLRLATAKLRRPDMNYSEDESVLLYTATSMLEILWPDEKINWTVPEVSSQAPYVAAIESARKGVYDFSSPNNDCLSCALPSLLLITVPPVNNYYAEAEENLKAALEFNKDSVFVPYLLALLYNRTNRYEKTVQVLTPVYEIEKSLPLILVYADALLKSENYSKAFAVCMENIQLFPMSVELIRFSAEAAFYQEKFDLADQYINQALQRQPENKEYILFRVRVLLALEEYMKASSLLDMYSRIDKTSKNYLLLRATLQSQWNKNIASASNTLRDALERYPNDRDVLLEAAALASSGGQKIGNLSASQMIDMVLAEDPNNSRAIGIFITEEMKKENWNSAYDASSKLISSGQINPDILVPHVDICVALGKNQECEKAIKDLEKILGENASPVIESKIKWYIAQGKNANASELITQLLPGADNKTKSKLYYERSRIAANEDEKLDDLRSSLAENPRNQNALFDLYELYFRKKDYRKAQYYLNQVVSLNPTDSKLLQLTEELNKLMAR